VNVYQVQQGRPSVLLEIFPLKEAGSAFEQPIVPDVFETPALHVEEAPPVAEQTAEFATFSEMPLPATHISNRRPYWIAAALATIAAGAATYTLRREAPRVPPPQTVIDKPVIEEKAGPPAPAPPSAPEQDQPTAAASVASPVKAKPTHAGGSRAKSARSKKAPAKKARSKKVPAATVKRTVHDDQ
jgi:hypothetical protein